MPRVIGGRYGLSSKEFTPGDGRRRLRRARRASGRGAASRSASTTTSPGTSLAYDPALDIEPADTVRAVFFGLGSDGTVGANKNTIKILGDEEDLHAQGYFVYDSKKSGSQTVSHLRFGPAADPRAVPRAAGELRRLPPVRPARPASTCSAARPHGATLLLNCPHPPDEVWDALSRPVQEQILAKHIDAVRDRRRPDRARGRPGRPHQHRPADLLLRHLRRAAARAGDRADQGGDREDLRPARRRGGRAQPGGGRPRARRRCTGSRCRRARRADARAAAGRARARARVRPHRHRGDDGRPRRRAAGQRAAGRRHLPERHGRLREAQHLRARRRLGRRPLHPVRQLQLRLPAQRDPLEVLRRVEPRGGARRLPVGAARRRRPARHPLHAAGLRRGLHRLRAVRRGLPGRRARASRPQGDQPRAARAARRRRAREHRVLRDAARRTTARGSTSARCAAPSSSSRCSSSPAPAPAAARRRT